MARWRFLVLLVLVLAMATAATAQDRGGRRREAAGEARPAPAESGQPPTNERIRRRIENVKLQAGGAPSASQQLMQESTGRVAYERPSSPSRQVAEFNTLTTALIAPTGEVLLLGTYDPAYASGPLPYPALLRDALERPEPALSLDPIPSPAEDAQFRQLLDQEAPRIANDLAYGLSWVNRVMELLWTSPAVAASRDALAARFEREFGITRPEFDGYARWKANPDAETTPPDARGFMEKFYAGAGQPGVGKAFALMNLFRETSDPNLLPIIGEALGHGPESQALVDRIQALPTGNARLEPVLELYSILYGEILTRLGAPAGEVQAAVASFRNAGGDESGILAYLDRVNGEFMGQAVGRKLLHGFPLGQDLLGQLYRLPPVQVSVNTFGAPLDSPTMRIFFHADYRMKGLCANGGAAGLPSDAAWLFENGGAVDQLRVRYWLVPDQVQMQTSPDGSVVRFGAAAVKVRARTLEAANPEAAAMAPAAERYADEITARYDALARESPSLHALRETAKVLALVRWAKARGLALKAPAAVPAEPALAATIPGMWGATFLVSPGLERNNLQFWRSGGVSFEQDEGSAWVQERPDPAAAGDVLQQLAGSTVLAEQAAAAALGGHLEQARELAERSAQAMVGGALPKVPEPVLARVVSPADEAAVAQSALAVVEENVLALDAARAELAAAEPLKAGAPEDYARALEASQRATQTSEGNLKRLQGWLAHYRQSPVALEQVALDLGALRPSTGGSVSAAPAGPSAPAAPAREALGPTREQMRKELEGLRAQLARLTEVQGRLTRTMLQDVAQYEGWQADVERGYQRSWDNLQGVLENEVLYYAKRYLKLKNAPQADQDAVKHLGEAVAARDVGKWGQEKKKDWEWVGKGIVMLAGAAGLDDELNRVLVSGSALIDASTDLASYYAAWKGMRALQGNPAAFEAANAANRKAMTELIQRIRDLEARVGAGPT